MDSEEDAQQPRWQWTHWVTRSRLSFFFAVFLIIQVALFLFLESTSGILDRRGHVRGQDFLQFYIAGRIVADGDVSRLYDHEHFGSIQRSLVEINEKCPPYFSIYPPLVALLFSPLSRLPYETAIVIWWSILAACFACAGWRLHQSLNPPPDWRGTAWLGLAAFFPVLNTFWNGQLAGLFLLVFVSGFELLQRRRPILAGCVLSILALKPQLILGVLFWLILRKDYRAVLGLAIGGLLQAAAVALVLEPQTILEYVRATRLYPQLFKNQFFSPDHQHGVAGILTNLFGGAFSGWSMLAHLLVVLYAGFLLRKVVASRPAVAEQSEFSAAILFSLLATPHLLTYDLAYLLIPIAYLISVISSAGHSSAIAIPMVLYLCATLSPAYSIWGFSLVPIVIVVALHRLAVKCLFSVEHLTVAQLPETTDENPER